MYIALVVILVVAGVGLLLLEMFLLPGFGIGGVAGFACLVGAVGVAYYLLGTLAGHVTLGAALVLSALAIYGFVKSRALEKMGLDTSIDAKVPLADSGKRIEELKKQAEPAPEKQEEH